MTCGNQEVHHGGCGMNRRVLVTGGTGFIGSRVLDCLLKNGDIPILIKRSFSDTWRIKELLDRLVICNLDQQYIENIFEKERIDAVINLATYYKKHNLYDDIEKMIEVNINFPTMLLELCKKYEVPLFITAGTYFQYGKNYKMIDENGTIEARNLYAATKSALEKIMEYYISNTDVRAVALLLFTPYGEMDHAEKVIPYIIKQALSNGTVKLSEGFQKLSPVYVEDVANAFVKALDLANKDIGNNLRINISGRESYSIREMVSIIEELLKFNIKAEWGTVDTNRIDQDRNLIVDQKKSENILGWQQKFDIYEGLRRTINYYAGEAHEH